MTPRSPRSCCSRNRAFRAANMQLRRVDLGREPRAAAERAPVADCPLVAGLRITDALAGRHLLVTGVTGFVGEALLERLLYDLPDTRVTVFVRPRGASTGEERTRQLLTKAAFERLRERDGEDAVAALVGTRIHVL